MRLLLILGFGLTKLYGQVCAPAPILPAGQVQGALDATSCSLSDGTPYAAFRLVLPGRGQVQMTLATATAAGWNVIVQDATGLRIASGTTIQRDVESGTYTVLVNGPALSAASPGPATYTLQTSFTSEPGTWCADFPAIGLNQAVQGALGATGCQAPDGTPYDAWAVSTLGAGTLTATISSTAFTPVLTLRGQDGSAIATDGASVSVPVTSFSQYEVVVASADTAGAYQVTTAFQPASSETCVPQKTLATPVTDANSITANSCAVVIDSGGDQAYFNYYNLTVTAAGLADLAAVSGDFTPTVNILDAAGNVLARDTGGGGYSAASGTKSEVLLPLAPGSYSVQVFSNYSSGGNYNLTYNFTPGNPQPCVPAAYTVGAAQPGTLLPSSCRTAFGLSDIYSVSLNAAGALNVQMSSSTFATQVAIRDAKDNLIVMNQDVEGLGMSQITATLPAGNYTILAAAGAGAGPYQLSTKLTPAAIPPCSQALPLALNGGYLQTLGVGSCIGSNGQPADLYQFTMPAAGVAAAVMTSSEVTGYLTLTDANGNVLRSDQNSYGPGDPFIVEYLPAGAYQLWARDATNSAGGQYLMSLLASPGPRPPFCGSLGPLALGGTINSALSIGSCQYVDNTFADMYQVTLSDATIIDLRLNSADFDAYLIVLDAKGNLIAQDDDSGGGTNARVIQQLNSGTYYVLAKQFANYYTDDGMHNYALSLAPYQN